MQVCDVVPGSKRRTASRRLHFVHAPGLSDTSKINCRLNPAPFPHDAVSGGDSQICPDCGRAKAASLEFVGPDREVWSAGLGFDPIWRLLAFSARRNGIWQLTRVRRWNSATPVIEHLELPGYFSSKDDHDLETLELKLFLTPDGRYGACAADAWWNKRVDGKSVGKSRTEIRISSIDLENFRVAGRATTAALSLFEFQGVFMRTDGQLVVESSSPQLKEGAFIPIDMPGLGVGPKCLYRNVSGPNNELHPIPIGGDTCLQSTHNIALEEYLTEPNFPLPFRDKFICTSKDLEYCPQPDRFSPDANIGLGIMTE